MEIVGGQLNEFKLKVGQAYAFYNLIGNEDKNSLLIQKVENKEKKE